MNENSVHARDQAIGRENGPALLLSNENTALLWPDTATTLPARHPELQIRALDNGQYVIKSVPTGEFLQLGEEEYFLLLQLDGEKDAATVCSNYEERFGQSITDEDFDEFVKLAGESHLLHSGRESHGLNATGAGDLELIADQQSAANNNLLYWRRNIFDPDQFFSWLVPRIGFFWTRTFFVLSATSIVLAVGLVWTNWHDLADSFPQVLRWETLAIVWVTFLVISVLHEFAHGLTCKRYGGEVHEIGILVMFLMPCLYCNVSEAWLFREKSKRMWVMFAGGYFELFLWALAAIVWRLTISHTYCNYIALVVLSLCGLQTLLNFIPFIKLDGYYLLSDWLEIPNLRQRALDHCGAHWRWLLWGAARPQSEPRGWLLNGFGLLCWLFSCGVLAMVLVGLIWIAGPQWGLGGCAAVALIGLSGFHIIWKGLNAMEIRKMAVVRPRRMFVWSLLVVAMGAVLRYVEVEDRVGGPFEIRPLSRAELRAPAAGFLAAVFVKEGDQVSSGEVVARLEIPDLGSRRKQKRLEVEEVEARLQLLEAGVRPEEITEQRQRVERARDWCQLANGDLASDRQALVAELVRLDQQITQHQAEVTAATDSLQRLQTLAASGAVTRLQLQEGQRRTDVARAQWEQAQAKMQLRKNLGTRETFAGLDANSELKRRESELADAEARLRLLEAGSRPEELQAERAHLARLREEEQYLNQLEASLTVQSSVSGIVTTPRLKDKCGHHLGQGDLICVVEDSVRLEVEMLLQEQDANATRIGQPVALRARALPRNTFKTRVTRLAPAAAKGDAQTTVTVYCEIENHKFELRTGMTGYARVYTGRKPIGQIVADRAFRFLRTEFWFW